LTDVSVETDRSPDARALLVLGHGAGGDLHDPLLCAVGNALSSDGIDVVRFNFPYREQGRKAPGAQSASEDCYRDVATNARRDGLPLYLGGKSYGGRMASHIVADGFDADALIFLSYPLHPPGKPDRVRDEHLRRIAIPMLFVQGSKDPFATPELLDGVVASLDNASLHRIEGGDHSLRVRGRRSAEVTTEVVDAIFAFVA
jgi:predicted alpha/beta-hydrolase family hydrolase